GAHVCDGTGKQSAAGENIGIFCKEAEDQTCHKVVHLMALLFGAPARVVRQKFHIQPVQAAGCTNITRAVPQLLDGSNARKWQEEAEMVWKCLIRASNGLAGIQIFCLEGHAICGQDVARLASLRRWAGPEGCQGLGDSTSIGYNNVDI